MKQEQKRKLGISPKWSGNHHLKGVRTILEFNLQGLRFEKEAGKLLSS